jgi:hypothetical protein
VTYAAGSSPYKNYIVDDIAFFNGKMFVLVRGHGVFYTVYQNRDEGRNGFIPGGPRRYDLSASGASVGPLNGGWLTTSTYDAGTPGLKKLWRKLVVDYAIPDSSCSLVAECSADNGETWATISTITTVTTRGLVSLYFNRQSSSLKLRFTLRSTSATKTPILFGYVVSYVPIPEPNWLWTFTIVLAEKLVLLDGTEETVDTEAEIAYLSSLYRSKVLIDFIDPEGTVWALTGPGALPYDITFALRDLNKPLEGEVTLTLLEAVENFS